MMGLTTLQFISKTCNLLGVCNVSKPSLLTLKIPTPFEPRYEKTGFCKCENKDADQLRGNREADQCLCFRYIDSTIHLLSK